MVVQTPGDKQSEFTPFSLSDVCDTWEDDQSESTRKIYVFGEDEKDMYLIPDDLDINLPNEDGIINLAGLGEINRKLSFDGSSEPDVLSRCPSLTIPVGLTDPDDMVYYDGTDYLVGGEALKDLSVYTWRRNDSILDSPKEMDPEVNIHAMDFMREDSQKVHISSQNPLYSTIPSLIRSDNSVCINVPVENVLPQSTSISSSQQLVQGFSSSIPSPLLSQSMQLSSQSSCVNSSAQPLQPFACSSVQACQVSSNSNPVYPTSPPCDHPITTKMKDVSSTEESDDGSCEKRRNGRHQWSKKEDEALLVLVKKYNKRHWKQISRELFEMTSIKRSETECRQHCIRVLGRNTKLGRWSAIETRRLYMAKTLFTEWSLVARFVGSRDVSQCKSKWIQLNTPCKGAREWTDEEHQMMMDLYNKMPRQWKEIAIRMNIGVTGEQVRTHYNCYKRSQEKNNYKCGCL